jgi:oligopeptide transport system permease protein
MGRYVIRRLLQVIPVFLGSTLLIYSMVFLIPGDPIRALGGDRPLPPAVQAQLRDRYRLDEPFIVQYVGYIGDLAQGDFGETFNGRPVTDILRQRVPVTAKLTLVAFVFEAILGLIAGVLAGLRRGSFMDSLVLVSTTAIVAIPTFVLGYVAQIYLGLKLDWFPIAGTQKGWYSYLLPGFVLGAISLAYIARLTRTSLVENLRNDYVRTAKAKGLPPYLVIRRHTLRNSLIPVVTFLGVDIGNLMGGAIITEGIYNLPGIGNSVFRAVQSQEGTVVVGIVTFLVLVFVLCNLLVDILYAFLDPRIRYE